MCRTYNEIVEQDIIVKDIDKHIEKNSLEPGELLMFRVSRETYIKQTISEEIMEERTKYPSMLWLMIKKPLAFFPGLLAVLLLFSFFFVEDARLYWFALMKIEPIGPGNYMAFALPAIAFLSVTCIIGAKK